MKKKILIALSLTIVALAVLLVPWRVDALNDGGTKDYRALTYRVICWKRLTGNAVYDVYEKTRVYFGADVFRDISDLWIREKPATDRRLERFDDIWLDKSTAQKYETPIFTHITITDIYADCFFAKSVPGSYHSIKINGTLSDEWCVGDQVRVTCENYYYDSESNRAEADLLTMEPSNYAPDDYLYAKPVIYLYPEEETEVSVRLSLNGKLTCTYPAYGNGWTVTAQPDGTLTDAKGQTYNYLYWEGDSNAEYDLSQGFCVKGEDTAAFLEDALEKLGLTRREANEFIVYWLPLMEQNPYNIISFQTERYTDAAKLEIEPAPDTLIRVFMAWQASEEFVELPAQSLTAPERKGFTAVEWGGTEMD